MVSMKSSQAVEHRVLILPSGGGTGIVPAVILAEIEKEVGQPVRKLFSQIWCSSVGSITAALLTIGQTDVIDPLSASEVVEFLEKEFSCFTRAIRVRGALRKKIPLNCKLSDTQIPVSILAANVTEWSKLGWPLKTELQGFSREGYSGVSLPDLVCASCTVFPFHPRAEKVRLECLTQKEHLDHDIYCIDAGAEACTVSEMNPLFYFLKEFSKTVKPEDSISVFFISNGWVHLQNSWSPLSLAAHAGSGIRPSQIKLINLDFNLTPVIDAWKQETWVGRLVRPINDSNARIATNLAGAGILSVYRLKGEAEKKIREYRDFKEKVENSSDTERESLEAEALIGTHGFGGMMYSLVKDLRNETFRSFNCSQS